MSCKRKHRARGLGCRVGAVRLRGCSRECCPYPDAAIDANERIDYSTRDSRSLPRPLPTDTPTDPATATDNDNDDEADWIDGTLAPAGHHACRAPYRPKFVCVPCRRVFKVAVIPGKEYVVWGENVGGGGGGRDGGDGESGRGGRGGNWVDSAGMGWWVAPAGWWVAPAGWYSKALEVAWGRVQRDPVRWEEAEMGVRAYHLNRDSGSKMGSGESGEEGREEGETSVEEAIEGVDVEELRKCHPDAWWRPLNERWVRCPGCGAAGQAVGSKFEAPPRGRGRAGGKKSEKAWRRVEERLRAGERFTYCMSRAEEERFLASRAQAQVAMEGI